MCTSVYVHIVCMSMCLHINCMCFVVCVYVRVVHLSVLHLSVCGVVSVCLCVYEDYSYHHGLHGNSD